MKNIFERRLQVHQHLIETAQGKHPFDLIIKNTNIVNQLTGEILTGDIGISQGFITTVIDQKTNANQIIDGSGYYTIPSFIDPHVHIESSMILPQTYAKIVATQGTGTIFGDPHEIVNVMGMSGYRLMVTNAESLPIRIYFDASTCVPAKRVAESSGADIQAKEVQEMLDLGAPKLAELMSVSEITNSDPIFQDITQLGWMRDIPQDSHYPMFDMVTALGELNIGQKISVFGNLILLQILKSQIFARTPTKKLLQKMRTFDHTNLDIYLLALGLTADHEVLGPESQLKLDHGMRLMLSSHQLGLTESLPMVLEMVKNLRFKDGIGMCTDDIWPDELVEQGGMAGVVRGYISHGIDPIDAIRFATYNNARRIALAGFRDARFLGEIRPGMVADLTMLKGSLKNIQVDTVIHGGVVIVKHGKYLPDIPISNVPDAARDTVKIPFSITPALFSWKVPDKYVGQEKITMNILNQPKPPNLPLPNLITADVSVKNGYIDMKGYSMISVINRHGIPDPTVQKALIKGYPLKNTGLASTVAHDSHNFIVLGGDTEHMALAANRVHEMQGGMVIAHNHKIIGEIRLDIGGLMTDRPIEQIIRDANNFRNALGTIGLNPKTPIIPFAVFSLPAVPGPKLTDKGFWDDQQQKLISPFVTQQN